MSRKSLLQQIKDGLFKFFFGEEIEFGDSVFFTISSLILITLFWLAIIEKYLHISVWGALIVWGLVVTLIWRGYAKYKKRRTR